MSRARDLAGIFNLDPLSGTTAERPATAEIGQIYYNGTTAKTQIYTATGWQDMASGIPFGNTAGRPSSPSIGQPYFNGELGYQEVYTNSGWKHLSGILSGNTAGRPSNPAVGQLYSNGELQRLELYTGATYGWQNIVAETPGVTGYTGTVYELTGGTITIVGTNFAGGAVASIIGSDDTEYVATSTTVNNLSSITATFPTVSGNLEPYDIKVTNPSNLYGVYFDILTVNDKPVWQTAAGSLGTFTEQTSISLTVAATDEENNTITYSLAAGSSLPTGVTLNSSTGVISGTLPDISADTTYTFTLNASDGTNISTRAFSITSRYTMLSEYLIVAGGGGAGRGPGTSSGGGGAGGLLSGTYNMVPATSYSLSVGLGGAGRTNTGYGNNGQNSSIFGLTAIGGGGSGADGNILAQSGGSGGGGGNSYSGNQNAGGGRTVGQGNVGGDGWTVNNSVPYASGGGGGAGAAGQAGNSTRGGDGGIGVQSSITGTAVYYAGGGTGGSYTAGVYAGGLGGGGACGNGDGGNQPGSNGTDGLGGGGGGSRWIDTNSSISSARGGSGVIIISYPNSYPALTVGAGLTYDQPTRSGYRVYRFTAGSGTVTA